MENIFLCELLQTTSEPTKIGLIFRKDSYSEIEVFNEKKIRKIQIIFYVEN